MSRVRAIICQVLLLLSWSSTSVIHAHTDHHTDSKEDALSKYASRTYGQSSGPLPSDRTLLPLVFEPLPLGSIKPQGWLLQQLELMANGLPGNLHAFYKHVKDATWLGGDSEYSGLNEAWPYWLNGLVPLAAALDDDRLMHAIETQVAIVLDAQGEDGWLGPEVELADRGLWARFLFFQAAVQLAQMSNTSLSRRLILAMHRFVVLMHAMLKADYQGYVSKEGDRFDEQWGRSRGADMAMSLQWLYEHRPEGNADIIHECMVMLYEKAYDWSYWYRDDVFVKDNIESLPKEIYDPLYPFIHGVNAAQGLKSPAIMARFTHDRALQNSSRQGVNLTFAHHGTATGVIIGDERMSDQSPYRGTELCSVVETMFSLSYLYQSLGDRSFADQLEKVAFNALPSMVMPYWWAHQYVSQANQPYAYELEDIPFKDVGKEGITFGLEPDYPCCTVNFAQGFPKLLSGSWVTTNEGRGLVHAVLVPSEVSTTLNHRKVWNSKVKQNNVHIKCETNYPFSDLLTYHITARRAFEFSFRIPEWVVLTNPRTGVYFDNTALSSQARPDESLNPNPHTGLHTIRISSGQHTIHVLLLASDPSLPSPARQGIHILPRPNNTIAIQHGSLIYAHSLHDIGLPRSPAHHYNTTVPPQSHDWTLIPRVLPTPPNTTDDTYTSIPWNMAIDPHSLRHHMYDNTYDPIHGGFPHPVFAPYHPPVSIVGMACQINWTLSSPAVQTGDERVWTGGYALPPPVGAEERRCVGRAFPVELRPVGSARLRVVEMVPLDLGPESGSLVGAEGGGWKDEL